MKGRGAVLIAAVVLSGCGYLPLIEREAPESCAFPPNTSVTLAGEAPLARLGLLDPGLESQDPSGGTVHVTDDAISRFMGEAPSRMWCVVYGPEDRPGSRGGTGPVPQGWTPPDG